MSVPTRSIQSSKSRASTARAALAGNSRGRKLLVSLVIPAYNEAPALEKNLSILIGYINTLKDNYDWEVIIVNDGSSDNTGEVAEEFARHCKCVRVLHHSYNSGLGQALQTAFRECRGNYVVTYDVDLSYSPDHIGRLLEKIQEKNASVVLASPYMEGGSIANVPRFRRLLSVFANRFLAFFARDLSTLTCMVRAYDGAFVRALSLRSTGKDVMPETIFKARILRSRMVQIPAHLDWGPQRAEGVKRRSSLHLKREVFATLVWGFIFRPFTIFIAPGFLLLLFSTYVNTWMFIHFFEAYFYTGLKVAEGSDRVTAAISAAYSLYPYTFIVGLLSLMLALQLIGLGMMALQNKKYFEEVFHLASGILRESREGRRRASS